MENIPVKYKNIPTWLLLDNMAKGILGNIKIGVKLQKEY